MAGAVQWTVNQFWAQLQSLKNQIGSVQSNLDTDKQRLTSLYAQARAEYDPAGASDRALLEPLIHQNTVLRLNYLAPVKAKFTEAVGAAGDLLRQAGYTTPQLSGVGVLPALVLVPVVAAAAVLVGLEAVAVVNRLTQAQISRSSAAASIMGNSGSTPEQKQALMAALTQQTDADRRANPPLFDVGWIVPALAIVAAIVLGPRLLQLLPARKGAA